MATNPPLVRIRNLRKSYLEGETPRIIFENLNFDIGAGEFIALLGRSGSGKSTLLNLVSGIDPPNGGEVQIGKYTITALSEQARTRFRRQYVGFVFQFFNLIPTLTVEENMMLPLELNGLYDDHHHQDALRLLNDVGLGKRRDSFPERLSGGEQQRLAIVRAVVHKPLLLLADEPTGNLDDETATQVLQLLLRLHQQAGTTMLMVTHSREVAFLADRVLQLETGRITETGS